MGNLKVFIVIVLIIAVLAFLSPVFEAIGNTIASIFAAGVYLYVGILVVAAIVYLLAWIFGKK